MIVDFTLDDLHRLDHARRPGRRRQAPAPGRTDGCHSSVATANIVKIFEITGLDRVFDIYGTRDDAVAKLSRNHPTVVVALKSALALTVVLLALLASGCGAVGRVTEGDPAHGKQLFLQSAKPSEPSCASCHTLADAKSQGTVGPNLDDAFASVKTGTFSEEQTIRDVVRGQIAYPEEPMPANLYRGQDARDIAVYIAKCAGNPNCGVTATTEGGPPAATTTTGGGGGGGSAPRTARRCSRPPAAAAATRSRTRARPATSARTSTS